ncbi:unnamed protein product, partial [Prorocentrum cordatum]
KEWWNNNDWKQDAYQEPETQEVLIFGFSARARAVASLRVMAFVEKDTAGYPPGLQWTPAASDEDGLARDVVELGEDQVSSVTPSQITAAQTAAGCGMELFGNRLAIVGSSTERRMGQ